MKGPVLLCAATRTEARAAAKGVEGAGLSRGAFEVLQTGMGARAAAEGLLARLEDRAKPLPSMVVSTGFAGSRARALGLGQLVVGTVVAREGAEPITLREDLAQALARAGVACVTARFVTTSAVVTGDAEGDHAVDMESYAWAELARARAIPAAIVRVISDTIERPIPEAIIALSGTGGATGAGRFARGIGSALSRPGELLGFVARVSGYTSAITACWARGARAVAGG